MELSGKTVNQIVGDRDERICRRIDFSMELILAAREEEASVRIGLIQGIKPTLLTLRKKKES